MWGGRSGERREVREKLIAVAIDKNKGSQTALKWATDYILNRGQTVVLLHVKNKNSSISSGLSPSVSTSSFSVTSDTNDDSGSMYEQDPYSRELFLPFRCFCTRKDIQCKDVVLEDTDVVKALIDYVTKAAIEVLVLGSPSKNNFLRRLKAVDIPASTLKGVPDFCTVYIISKGKISSTRAAARPAPAVSPLRSQLQYQASLSRSEQPDSPRPQPTRVSKMSSPPTENMLLSPPTNYMHHHGEFMRSPFTHRMGPNGKPYGEIPTPERDTSFASSSGRPSTERSVDMSRSPKGWSGRPSTERAGPSYSESVDMSRSPKIWSGRASTDRGVPSYIESVDMNRSPKGWSGRPSTDRGVPSYIDSVDMSRSPKDWSSSSEIDNGSCYDLLPLGPRYSTPPEFSAASAGSDKLSTSPTADDVEAEMRRLKMELKQTMDMYSTACKEANRAKEMAKELQRWKMEEEKRLEEARLAEESVRAIIEREKEKSRAAIEAAAAAQRLAEIESQKRIKAEMKALREAEEKDMVINRLGQTDNRCRRYPIEDIEVATNYFSENRKIGEGGYGPVYKCYLDHTPVAVKVLRPDAVQGRSQFQQEVDVLSCIRHPNMVLLLGACPEYGCLVYEFMSNGTLEDCLFSKGKKPPLTWQQRFRIAAEITTGLNFLHQTKPEPLVHRDLKPANILLDRNFVAKIGDVGLSRLVPPAAAENSVTQYRMTTTAGTFCYIDPEYQQTGMLGVKSDVYSLGIMFLQIITAKPPMGLTHLIEMALEDGTFSEILDPLVPDWPLEDTMMFAKLSLQCAELRRRDRPDLGKVVLPELERLREIADQSGMYDGIMASENHSQVSMCQGDMSYTQSQSVTPKSRSPVSGRNLQAN